MDILAGRYGKVGLVGLLVAVFMLFAGTVWAAPQHSVDEWLDITKQLADEDKYVQAFEQYDKALKEYPDNVALLRSRGMLRNDLGDTENAAKDFQKIIDLGNEDVDAYIGLAVAAGTKGNAQECLKLFAHAADLNDAYAPLYIWRGRMYYQGIVSYQDAIKDFEQAKAYVTPDMKTYLLFSIMVLQEDYAGQHPEYNSAVVEAANELLAEQNLSAGEIRATYDTRMRAYDKLGKYDEALADSQKLLAMLQEENLYTADVEEFQSELLKKMQQPAEAK